MYLSEIELRNFRNYENRQVEFSPGINVFIGENAQGKTNLLEAIYVLAMTRSHRTANDRELINWQAKEAMVKGTVIKQAGRVPLEVLLGTRGKRVKVNHLFQSRLSTYIGNLNVVLFAPEDLALVKGAPQERRQFMDTEFSQMSSRYLYAISQFRGLLKQRNEYLKQLKYGSQVDQVLLEVLSDQLAESGAAVTAMRFKLLKLYHEYQSQEIKLGTTLYGPQRDDIRFLVNEQDVHHFGSQGQQRTTALAVKLAEIDLMNEQTGEYPLLLLDDVLSELDDDRQTHLLTAIQDKVQTFLTTTSLSGVARQLINRPTIFQIAHGTIDKEDKK